VRLFDTPVLRRGFAGGFGGELFARRFAAGAEPGSLLGTGHLLPDFSPGRGASHNKKEWNSLILFGVLLFTKKENIAHSLEVGFSKPNSLFSL
jgi:hypothetical protein